MKDQCASHIVQMSYYDFFNRCYAPQLQAIDLLLKTMEQPLTKAETAQALDLSATEVQRIMTAEKITDLDRHGFLQVMQQGSSEICRLYRRETACGSPFFYRPEDIAYIYGLEKTHVAAVCKQMGMRTVTARAIPALLRQISIYIVY